MTNTINGRTPEEIKRGLGYCKMHRCPLLKCPYFNESYCGDTLNADALAYIQQLESSQLKWISVEERLPEEEGMYIVYITRNKGNAFIGTDRYDFLNHWCGEGWYDGRCVTHWMPFSSLSEPPKEEA